MRKAPNIGKIYDTLFFCIRYFNDTAVTDRITNHFTDTSFMEECYHEIKAKIPTLPDILAPVFFYQDSAPTAMTEFFANQIDYENDTIDSFLKTITSKSDILYSKIVDSVFNNNQNLGNRTVAPLIAPETYIQALSDSEYSEDFKLQISLLFGNFNYAVSVLNQQLRDIYAHIDALHQKYVDRLSVEWQQIQSERNLKLYKQLFLKDIASYNDHAFVTISLLNQYIIRIVPKNNNIEVLLGFHHEEEINQYFDEQNIDLHQLLTAVGNETRLSILQLLLEKEELTASSIAKMINIPVTTVLRHMEILYNCGALYVSKRQGLQIFYRINFNLLSRAIKVIDHKINNKLLGGKSNEPNERENIIPPKKQMGETNC